MVKRSADRVEWAPCSEQSDHLRGTRIVATVATLEKPLPWDTEGTLLRLEHSGWQTFDDATSFCNTRWSYLLGGFKHLCETGNASPARWRPERT